MKPQAKPDDGMMVCWCYATVISAWSFCAVSVCVSVAVCVGVCICFGVCALVRVCQCSAVFAVVVCRIVVNRCVGLLVMAG